jgi:hypothetical protein
MLNPTALMAPSPNLMAYLLEFSSAIFALVMNYKEKNKIKKPMAMR